MVTNSLRQATSSSGGRCGVENGFVRYFLLVALEPYELVDPIVLPISEIACARGLVAREVSQSGGWKGLILGESA
jgi:hypothetical protein